MVNMAATGPNGFEGAYWNADFKTAFGVAYFLVALHSIFRAYGPYRPFWRFGILA